MQGHYSVQPPDEACSLLSQESRADLEARVVPHSTPKAMADDVDDDIWERESVSIELRDPPEDFESCFVPGRRNAVFVCNPSMADFPEHTHPKALWSTVQLSLALEDCPLFHALSREEVTEVCDRMKVEFPRNGDVILTQGQVTNSLFVVLDGVAELYFENDPDRIEHRGVNSVVGEVPLLWMSPCAYSVRMRSTTAASCMIGRLPRQVYEKRVKLRQYRKREVWCELLRNVSLLETLDDEGLAKLVDIVKERSYMPGDKIIRQGDEGEELFIMLEGEAVVSVRIGDDVQEHRHYFTGDFFGERAVLTGNPRAASVIAVTNVETISLTRRQFERMHGSLNQLQEVTYLSDPRKLIADFYRPGNKQGPRGTMLLNGLDVEAPVPKGQETKWFVVYRPTSRDAIAKMLSGVAVGKGLNVKGKSAKKNILSGYVPFLQISNNDHKAKVEPSPTDARLEIYYKSEAARSMALKALEKILAETAESLKMADPRIWPVDDYVPNTPGLNMPELLMREAYITRPDIQPGLGWETGRPSEPAFMDMNLHAVREKSEPRVVLFQYREDDPMNPRGLLIAYAEQFVKPVVSDFDTFLVASKGMVYPEPLPPEQAALISWCLEHAENIFNNPGQAGWTSRWLEVLKMENERGFHPALPKYGFADPTSYRLIDHVIKVTEPCGAVRHGAECFNFYFPQELDDEYLVVWEGFQGKPWAYKSERELRAFLMGRAKEGYAFPLNPVWTIRDPGWYDILKVLRKHDETKTALQAWLPPSTGIIKKIDQIKKLHPKGFFLLDDKAKQGPDETAKEKGCPLYLLGRGACTIA